MKRFCAEMGLFWVTFGVLLTHFTAHATEHDLTCHAIIQPSGKYVLADSAITPKLGVANLGTSPEYNFYVHLLSLDTLFGDTVYAESVLVNSINAYPDSIEVELPDWTPEGLCKDSFSRYYNIQVYETIGVTRMITDEDHSNDTLRDTVTSLWMHNVGVTDLEIDPDPTTPPDRYSVGACITFTATVENFGFSPELDVPIRLEVWDRTASPDTLVWQNTQLISVLNWCGDTSGNVCTVEVFFPVFTIPSDNAFLVVSQSIMEDDQCLTDNEIVRYIGHECEALIEGKNIKPALDISTNIGNNENKILFAISNPCSVQLDVFDASGRFVCNLYNDPCSAGAHSLTWDGKDLRGRKVPSGAYFVRMKAGEYNKCGKLLIVR